jgi:hypothetical protein
MSESVVTINAKGVLDHSRAETLAARIRAAVRNGKRKVTLELEADTVIASASFMAFLVRAKAVLKREGGQLHMHGDERAIQQLRALSIMDTGEETTPIAEGNLL